MDEETLKLAENLIPSSYVRQARDASRSTESKIRQLLNHKKLPENGWDTIAIEFLLIRLSSMDSNNFSSNCGVGEREARFASELVAQRHFHLGHGIGRSGDLTEPQPKAAGSSLIYKLTNALLQDLFQTMGIKSPISCLLVPVATGMALVLSMLTFRLFRLNARYVLWSRIDQKACFKSIITAGFIPVIIDCVKDNDQLITDIANMKKQIEEIGSENICCIITTTSCFAPRACDKIEDVAILCKTYQIPHLINNAYGLQSEYLINRIEKSNRKGRVDIFVQSTDKNLMVPVGGAIVSSFDDGLLQNVAKMYPGRASSSPVIDVFITLLHLGKNGYKKLVQDRVSIHGYLYEKLSNVAESFGEHILHTPENPISMSMTLSNIPIGKLTELGSMLFWRNVSGTRVITAREDKTIANHNFTGWGSHCKDYQIAYLTAAASIGMKQKDVDMFIQRLTKVLNQMKKN